MINCYYCDLEGFRGVVIGTKELSGKKVFVCREHLMTIDLKNDKNIQR